MKIISPFNKQIFVTRPIFPKLNDYLLELNDIWNSGWLSNNGPKLKKLEFEISKLLRNENVSVFNNGTTALLIALKCLKLKGEVITTPFTFPATINCLIWNNLAPVFCDIDNESLNIDVSKIESLITKNTSAILAVHVFGNPCDVYKINDIAKKYNLKVIYDAAHAFDSEINGIPIGNFGDISMFSFHPTKLFHTGEGGALVFRERKVMERANLLKNFGIKDEFQVIMPGINGKMGELQAAMGLVVLKYINAERKKRELIRKTYEKYLKENKGITIMKNEKNNRNSLQYFVIRINEEKFGVSRDFVYDELKKYNVFARKYFYPLCSEYPFLKNLNNFHETKLPVSNNVVNEVLCLPFYGDLKPRDIIKICRIINSFSRN